MDQFGTGSPRLHQQDSLNARFFQSRTESRKHEQERHTPANKGCKSGSCPWCEALIYLKSFAEHQTSRARSSVNPKLINSRIVCSASAMIKLPDWATDVRKPLPLTPISQSKATACSIGLSAHDSQAEPRPGEPTKQPQSYNIPQQLDDQNLQHAARNHCELNRGCGNGLGPPCLQTSPSATARHPANAGPLAGQFCEKDLEGFTSKQNSITK